MTKHSNRLSLPTVTEKLKSLGADLVGVTCVESIIKSPSSLAYSQLDPIGIGCKVKDDSPKQERIKWREEGKSLIVIAVSHPENKPELDWWYEEYSPPGNQKLIKIFKEFGEWINIHYTDIKPYSLPYHVEKGGVFLKDAAVMAGLGIIGRNNLLITPEYGPRLRLRAMVINIEMDFSGFCAFDPCSECAAYCQIECPQGAFAGNSISKNPMMKQKGKHVIPGNYSQVKCNNQMEADIKEANEKIEQVTHKPSGRKVQLLKYCRQCELSCPIGNK